MPTFSRGPSGCSTSSAKELEYIRDKFADKRRTEIIVNHEDLTIEDLISPEDVVVTLSHGGYAKAQPVSAYQAQRRGGRGKAATTVKDEDFVDKLFVANTHDTLLCFSDHGKLYWLKVYQLPQASRGSRGKPIVNLLPLQEGERISAMLSIKEFEEGKFVFMATSLGTVKKTPLGAVLAAARERHHRRRRSMRATSWSAPRSPTARSDILLFTTGGKAIRFVEDEVRPMGREAAGVRGVTLGDEQRVNALIVADQGYILTASENGYGKLTPLEDYPAHGRGGQGVIALQVTRSQRPHDRRAAGQPRRRDHAHEPGRRAGAHAGQGHFRGGPQHPGRAPDPARGGRSAVRPRAHRRPGDGEDGARRRCRRPRRATNRATAPGDAAARRVLSGRADAPCVYQFRPGTGGAAARRCLNRPATRCSTGTAAACR